MLTLPINAVGGLAWLIHMGCPGVRPQVLPGSCVCEIRARKLGAVPFSWLGVGRAAAGLSVAAGHPALAGSWENIQNEFLPSLLLGGKKKWKKIND